MVYSLVATVWVIIHVAQEKKKLKEERAYGNKGDIGAEIAGLKQLLYVLAFWLTIPYSTIKRLVNIGNPNTPFEAALVQACIVPLQCFLCFFVYAYLEGHLSRTKDAVRRKLEGWTNLQRRDSQNGQAAPLWYEKEQYV